MRILRNIFLLANQERARLTQRNTQYLTAISNWNTSYWSSGNTYYRTTWGTSRPYRKYTRIRTLTHHSKSVYKDWARRWYIWFVGKHTPNDENYWADRMASIKPIETFTALGHWIWGDLRNKRGYPNKWQIKGHDVPSMRYSPNKGVYTTSGEWVDKYTYYNTGTSTYHETSSYTSRNTATQRNTQHLTSWYAEED